MDPGGIALKLTESQIDALYATITMSWEDYPELKVDCKPKKKLNKYQRQYKNRGRKK